MHTQPIMFLSEAHTRRAIFGHLQQCPCAAPSLAALIGADLGLIQVALDRLVEERRVIKNGALYQFPVPAQAA